MRKNGEERDVKNNEVTERKRRDKRKKLIGMQRQNLTRCT
jgi:hypothetical protein